MIIKATRRYWFLWAGLVFAACSAPSASEPDMAAVLAEKPAPFLSDYKLFTAGGAPSLRVTPYDLINPLFTDYAEKQRFIFVPAGKTIQYKDESGLEFPVGTVLVKSFSYAPDLRVPDQNSYTVETRLLIHKKNGWAAYPYIWNADQSEARYAPVGGKRHIQAINAYGEKLDFTYVVPNANQCKTCHQSGHDITPIGPKARNLNHHDQLGDWAQADLLEGDFKALPMIPKAFDREADLNDRARAYLDINCAHCHNATGSASNSGLWLDWNEASPVRFGIKKHPTAAGRGAGGLLYVIEPGHAEQSILPFRMASTRAGIAMPELGRTLADTEGVTLIKDWIAAMPKEGGH